MDQVLLSGVVVYEDALPSGTLSPQVPAVILALSLPPAHLQHDIIDVLGSR